MLKPNENGASILHNDKWYIIYNDNDTISSKRFTVAHELGHILLGHPHKSGYFSQRNGRNYESNEMQADSFASRLLSPACILWGLDLHTPEEIADYCQISMWLARFRANRMRELYERNKFLTHPLERQVYANFEEYIQINRR